MYSININKVIIERFKSINNIELDTQDLNALVGKNNYGKTAIFEAIRVFFGDIAQLKSKDIHMHNASELPEITIQFVDVDFESMKLLMNENEPDCRPINIKAYFTQTTNGYSTKYQNLENDTPIKPRDLKSCLPEVKYISSIRQPEDTTFNNKSSNLQQLMDLLITA